MLQALKYTLFCWLTYPCGCESLTSTGYIEIRQGLLLWFSCNQVSVTVIHTPAECTPGISLDSFRHVTVMVIQTPAKCSPRNSFYSFRPNCSIHYIASDRCYQDLTSNKRIIACKVTKKTSTQSMRILTAR